MPADTEQLEIVYEGWNGAVFHWSGGDLQGAEGVGFAMVSQGSAFEDMYESPKETIYNSTAFQIGGSYEGLREHMFEFTLAFHIKALPGVSWRIVDSRFRKAMSYTKDSKLRVKIVGETERWLNVRLRGQPKLKVETDPNKQQYGLLLVTFVAPYPRWVEADWTSSATAQTDTTGTITAPSMGSTSTATSGGTLAAATWYYKVTSTTTQGETTPSSEVSQATTGTTSTVTINWSAVTGATGYRIYRSTASGSEVFLTAVTPGSTTSFTDTGSITPTTAAPPTTNTANSSQELLSVTVANNTDQEQWIKWVGQAGNAGVTWTLPDFSWGDDRFNRPVQDAGRMIVMPALINGENIVVDTDPLAIAGQVVSSLDTQVYQRMNGRTFMYPIPPYTPPTAITVAVTGAQAGNGIQVRVPRTWSRPWGLE